MMNKYQKEYVYRINRVVDFIDQNLDQQLTVEKLAEVAHFSPFHFHRIFSAFIGEPLNAFVKRLRIEKAARMLLHNPDTPVSEIAYYCGFNNVSVFCRNFKQHFHLSAQEYREKKNSNYSKNSQSQSKIGKSNSSADEYVCDVESLFKGGKSMKKNIQIKEMPELNLVYTRHTGAFHLIGQAYEKLFMWAGPRGLLENPNLKTATVYHDDPNVTEMDKLRQSACITVEKEVKTEGEFGFMKIPAGKYAVGRYEITTEGFEQAWNEMCLWLSGSGFQPDDALPYELYHNNHLEHPENKFILDICIPVKPM
jgi:AraC family transcriptional regulator